MGVPKFFRWLSERYPKINQRRSFPPNEATVARYFQEPVASPSGVENDAWSQIGLSPQVDRLYLDMNGILHGCSHNNSDEDEENTITHAEIFRNVCYYLDRLIGDIAQPTQLVYMAVDGVAPRAKLNQQRSRRYRSGKERKEDYTSTNTDPNAPTLDGRLVGKYEATEDAVSEDTFHSNVITPGTVFFEECTQHLEHFIQYKLTNDPKWQHLNIVLSGSSVPGEGEHKIMQFMRNEQAKPDYNPNLRHCIMGQDGDLIMLGLATHEPNLVLLRERVYFNQTQQQNQSISGYVHNSHFEFLHMSVLRDYLAFEMETNDVVTPSPFELEHTIDDFVFLTFLVGNDFLPHMPALDIGDEAFDLLFYAYRQERDKWLAQTDRQPPYLTHRGNIVSGRRLEQFLSTIATHETPYYEEKKKTESEDNERIRRANEKHGWEQTVPSPEVLATKESSDRARYREMLQSLEYKEDDEGDRHRQEFVPVLSASGFKPEKEELDQSFLSRVSKLVLLSVSGDANDDDNINDQDLKGRYYYDKFGFTPVDAEKHLALRKSYIEGLVWNLKYYYEGCASWEWFYPYHYGPMLSDLTNLDEVLEEVSFEDRLGEPLKPFEQLMGCMPPSHAYHLPKPYQQFMTDHESPIIDFYPKTFTVDMNGKRWPWEAVVLLPFIDSKRLLEASRSISEDMLTEDERERNKFGQDLVYTYDPSHNQLLEAVGDGDCFGAVESNAKVVPFASTSWHYEPPVKPVFSPKLKPGLISPLPDFPGLRTATVQSLWRRHWKVNIFGSRSRYRTCVLDLREELPPLPSVDVLAARLIGTIVYINYPYLTEGFVTAISTFERTYRGNHSKTWSRVESSAWKIRKDGAAGVYLTGDGIVGSGGILIQREQPLTVSVRPLAGIDTLSDGSKVKTYAKFELEVPLSATLWSPAQEDPRLVNIPARLEKDPFKEPLEVKVESRKALLPTVKAEAPVKKKANGGQPLLPPNEEAKLPKSKSGGKDGNGLLPPLVKSRNDRHRIPAIEPLPPRESEFSESTNLGPFSLSNLHSIPMVEPVASRGFATKVKGTPMPPLGGRRRYSTAARGATTLRSVKGVPRGRLLAVGVVAAATLFGQTSAHSFGKSVLIPSHGPLSLSSCNVRGGALMDPSDVESDDPTPPPLEFAHGTTTLSFLFKGGIVAAVDSRASIGNFVGSKTVQKVLPVNSHMVGTMAGGAADCSFWLRKLQGEAMLHELSENRRMSVARASRLLSNALYENRGLGLSVGTMILGFDPDGTPRVFYVDNSGMRLEGDVFAVGSGSTFALGILDTERRYDMTEEEAIHLGIKAIRHATFRDAGSGGFINVYLITKEDGWKKVFTEDVALAPEHRKTQKSVVVRSCTM